MNIEHANVTVADIEEATRFLTLVYPSIKIRGEGARQTGGSWRHVGTDDSYIALQQEAEANYSQRESYVQIGLNHLGFIVSDLKGVIDRLTEAGYTTNEMGDNQAGRSSVYYYDASGNEWEFVQYHSDDVSVRNVY